MSRRAGMLGACAALLTHALVAQSIEEFPLRPVAESKDAPLTEQISYRQNSYDDRGFNRIVEKVAVPTVTVYRPARAAHRGAAIVLIPGGGYQFVVIDREGHQLARYFQQQGITAIVLKYRLPTGETPEGPTLPLPQQDALAAIQYARSHALEWGIDPKRVGVIGSSAGGHLAGSMAVLGDASAGSRPDFIGLLYPVVTFKAPHAHAGSRKNLIGASATPEKVREYSLETRAKAGMPPHFLVHARDDTVVPYQNSEMLAAALQQAGVPVELRLINTGKHGFALGRGEESSRWKDAFVQWLDKLP
ncbi:alpha/beta hydrolase [Oleiharenicola lentus]|uniref:alpha/beta hydrolase n=1 Tax=Oleiharenicola lentus TaxID=2508720 RepID=UPI003F6662C1